MSKTSLSFETYDLTQSKLQSLYTDTQTQNSNPVERMQENVQQKIDRMELKEKSLKAHKKDLQHRDKLLKKQELGFGNLWNRLPPKEHTFSPERKNLKQGGGNPDTPF